MRKKLNSTRKFVLAFVATFLISASIVSAAMTWSDVAAFSLSSKQRDWKQTSETGNWVYNAKTTNDNKFDVYVNSKQMWTSPKFRLVNSNGIRVTDEISMPSVGRQATGTGNTGLIGYRYYASLKPAWNQVGVDRITFQFKSR